MVDLRVARGSALQEHEPTRRALPQMAIPLYSRRLALLFAAVVLTTAQTPSAAAQTPQRSHPLSKKAKAKIRAELKQQVRKDPTSVFQKRFMRKADLVDFKLPLTVRLGSAPGQPSNPDDQIQIDWDDSVVPWPLAGSTPAGSQTTTLSGLFTMEADFSDDASGYGELGSVETYQGIQTDLRGTPFDVAAPNSSCPPSPTPPPQLTATHSPGYPEIRFVSGGPRYGLMNLFGRTMKGMLMLSTTLDTNVSDSCGAPVATTGTPPAGPAFPLRYDGEFYVSPALTADGKMRLGKMVITAPQTSTFALFPACTSSITADCTPMQFPARVQITKLTADVLLGDIRSS